jgi:hypothetical protein
VVSSGKRQFGRVVRVIVKSANGETTSIDGFDISFDVDKNLEPEPNKAKIKIYNLPEDFRNKLQLKDDSKITLEAGYRQTVAAIFEGNLTHALSGIEGPDWVTQITAEEGVKAYRSSYVAKSYGAGTPFKSVVEDIVKTFEGFKITPAITATLSSIGKSFPNGLTLDGQSAKVLNDILRGVGLGFSIQNGQLQILRTGGANDQPAVQLDYSSGLVGIPQLGEKTDKATIKFQCFVQPEIVPGRRILLLEPKSVKGTYVCQTVKPKGSNFDNEFYDHIEAFIP